MPTLDDEQFFGLLDAAGADVMKTIVDAFWESTDELSGELAAAIASQDCSAIKKVGHAIKGSAANIGAALLAERAGLIEQAADGSDASAVVPHVQALNNDIATTRSAIDAAFADVAA